MVLVVGQLAEVDAEGSASEISRSLRWCGFTNLITPGLILMSLR